MAGCCDHDLCETKTLERQQRRMLWLVLSLNAGMFFAEFITGWLAGSTALMRMTAWGQTSAHFEHWMQMAGSQTGISCARLRFSYWVVPLGYVPSMGMALTGRLSPRRAIIALFSCAL